MNHSFQVNAWLERVDPLVEFRDRKTGDIVLSLHGNILHEILSVTNLSHDDLLSEKHVLNGLMDELFSQQVTDALGVQNEQRERRKKMDAKVIKFKSSNNEALHITSDLQEYIEKSIY